MRPLVSLENWILQDRAQNHSEIDEEPKREDAITQRHLANLDEAVTEKTIQFTTKHAQFNTPSEKNRKNYFGENRFFLPDFFKTMQKFEQFEDIPNADSVIVGKHRNETLEQYKGRAFQEMFLMSDPDDLNKKAKINTKLQRQRFRVYTDMSALIDELKQQYGVNASNEFRKIIEANTPMLPRDWQQSIPSWVTDADDMISGPVHLLRQKAHKKLSAMTPDKQLAAICELLDAAAIWKIASLRMAAINAVRYCQISSVEEMDAILSRLTKLKDQWKTEPLRTERRVLDNWVIVAIDEVRQRPDELNEKIKIACSEGRDFGGPVAVLEMMASRNIEIEKDSLKFLDFFINKLSQSNESEAKERFVQWFLKAPDSIKKALQNTMLNCFPKETALLQNLLEERLQLVRTQLTEMESLSHVMEQKWDDWESLNLSLRAYEKKIKQINSQAINLNAPDKTRVRFEAESDIWDKTQRELKDLITFNQETIVLGKPESEFVIEQKILNKELKRSVAWVRKRKNYLSAMPGTLSVAELDALDANLKANLKLTNTREPLPATVIQKAQDYQTRFSDRQEALRQTCNTQLMAQIPHLAGDNKDVARELERWQIQNGFDPQTQQYAPTSPLTRDQQQHLAQHKDAWNEVMQLLQTTTRQIEEYKKLPQHLQQPELLEAMIEQAVMLAKSQNTLKVTLRQAQSLRDTTFDTQIKRPRHLSAEVEKRNRIQHWLQLQSHIQRMESLSTTLRSVPSNADQEERRAGLTRTITAELENARQQTNNISDLASRPRGISWLTAAEKNTFNELATYVEARDPIYKDCERNVANLVMTHQITRSLDLTALGQQQVRVMENLALAQKLLADQRLQLQMQMPMLNQTRRIDWVRLDQALQREQETLHQLQKQSSSTEVPLNTKDLAKIEKSLKDLQERQRDEYGYGSEISRLASAESLVLQQARQDMRISLEQARNALNADLTTLTRLTANNSALQTQYQTTRNTLQRGLDTTNSELPLVPNAITVDLTRMQGVIDTEMNTREARRNLLRRLHNSKQHGGGGPSDGSPGPGGPPPPPGGDGRRGDGKDGKTDARQSGTKFRDQVANLVSSLMRGNKGKARKEDIEAASNMDRLATWLVKKLPADHIAEVEACNARLVAVGDKLGQPIRALGAGNSVVYLVRLVGVDQYAQRTQGTAIVAVPAAFYEAAGKINCSNNKTQKNSPAEINELLAAIDGKPFTVQSTTFEKMLSVIFENQQKQKIPNPTNKKNTGRGT